MKQQRQEISCQESWKQSAQTISFDWIDLLSETMSKGKSDAFPEANSKGKQFQNSRRTEYCEIYFILIYRRPNSTKWIYLGSIFILFH